MNSGKINRREFLGSAGTGSLAALATAMFPAEIRSAINNTEPMKITKIEGVRFKKGGFTWVRLHTNNGIVGVGETYPRTESEIGALKDASRLLLGKDPRDIERIWRDMYARASFNVTGGAEMRIISAVNMALWDILGKSLGIPVYRLLGGKAQQKLRVYNTYTDYWRINNMTMDQDTEKITRFLLDHGIPAIKIYPYEVVGRKTGGTYISPVDIDNCLDWVKRIRDTAGKQMEICIDTMCRWNLPCAMKIAHSLEPYDIMFIEDMLLPDNAQSYSVMCRETSIPVCHSERLATRYGFREMFEAKAIDIVMYDLGWVGGISEAKKISDMADTYYIPTAPHMCIGPAQWLSIIHTATALTNFFIMESGWHFWHETYPYYMKDVPGPVDGFITAPEKPGLGLEVRPEIFDDGEAVIVPIAEI
jgi:galactonate dehydratase